MKKYSRTYTILLLINGDAQALLTSLSPPPALVIGKIVDYLVRNVEAVKAFSDIGIF